MTGLLRGGDEGVVVLGAAQGGAGEADAVFDAEDGGEAEEGFSQVGFEFVENGFA